ncbi:MAG: DUF1018 domain-containing protein [Sulfurovaceae bacterium]|nr:DUF1018 domain-containing protein [Sulfurovaceae bacterium]
MNKKQEIYKTALIRLVHLSPKYRSYYKDNKDDYKERLKKAFGVDSSKKLTITQLEQWVGFLNNRIDELPDFVAPMISQPQMILLKKLWSEYARDTSDEALLRFSMKINKNAVLHVEQLTSKEASKLIIALKKNKRSSHGR